MQAFLESIEEHLEDAIEAGDWKLAAAYKELRDCFFYNKQIRKTIYERT